MMLAARSTCSESSDVPLTRPFLKASILSPRRVSGFQLFINGTQVFQKTIFLKKIFLMFIFERESM